MPLGPTGYGDSPYQSFSSFAGNPYFIDLEMLIDQGLLLEEEVNNIDFGQDESRVNYGKLYENRFKVLKLAYNRFDKTKYTDFVEKNKDWIIDYADFMAKRIMNKKSFTTFYNMYFLSNILN